MEHAESPGDLSARLASIRERLSAYEARQLELLGSRGDSSRLVIAPGEDQGAVERAYRMVKRGGLMRQPASEEEVALFERAHGIELPTGYRRFLTEVGNGGEGPPLHGLLPLGETPEGQVPDPLRAGYGDLLSRPFPFEQPWVWEEEAPSHALAGRIATVGHGNLILGHEGCGQHWSLVVTGRQRGQIWSIADGGIQPCAPPLGFLDWYEHWLDGGDDWWREYDPGPTPEPAARDRSPEARPPGTRPWWKLW